VDSIRIQPDHLLLINFDPSGPATRGASVRLLPAGARPNRDAARRSIRQLIEPGTAQPVMTRSFLSTQTDYVPRSADDPGRSGKFRQPRYFATMGIPLVEGRQLSNRDSSGSARVRS